MQRLTNILDYLDPFIQVYTFFVNQIIFELNYISKGERSISWLAVINNLLCNNICKYSCFPGYVSGS